MAINDKQVYQLRLTDGFICVVLLINFISEIKRKSKNKRVHFTIQGNILLGKSFVQG
jgi:hypothetical protein